MNSTKHQPLPEWPPRTLMPADQATKDILSASYRDFAIVCHQRSGSHLLATALNSHPDICCQGELLQVFKSPMKRYAPKPVWPTGIAGAIMMYSHWKLVRQLGIAPQKFIHLLRSPEATAISVARNRADSLHRGPDHRPHATRDSPVMHVTNFDASLASEVIPQIEAQQQRFSVLLSDCAMIEIRYEDLTNGQDIVHLPSGIAAELLSFLGARVDVALKPTVRKTSLS